MPKSMIQRFKDLLSPSSPAESATNMLELNSSASHAAPRKAGEMFTSWALKTSLLPHQTQALNFSEQRMGIMVLDQMGLGKTLTSLAIAHHKKAKTILCVVPKALFKNWEKEIHKHTTLTVFSASGNKQKRLKILIDPQPGTVILINPEGLRILVKEFPLFQDKYDALIVDELTRFRRWSQQSKALYRLAKTFRCRIGLSGGLVTENFSDVFNPFRCIDLGKTYGNDYFSYRKRYFTEITDTSFPKPDGSVAHPWEVTEYGRRIIRTLLHKNALMRGVEDIGQTMPTTESTIYNVSLAKEQVAALEELKQEWQLTVEGHAEQYNYTLQCLQKAHQISSGFVYKSDGSTYWFPYSPKVQVLQSLVEEVGDDKFIIWCAFKAEKAILEKLLSEQYNLWTGDPSEFDNNKCQGLILTFSKDAQGHNIRSARHSIFFSRPFSNDKYQQARGRNKRLDSDHAQVSEHILLTDTGIEKLIDSNLKAKMEMQAYIKGEGIELW